MSAFEKDARSTLDVRAIARVLPLPPRTHTMTHKRRLRSIARNADCEKYERETYLEPTAHNSNARARRSEHTRPHGETKADEDEEAAKQARHHVRDRCERNERVKDQRIEREGAELGDAKPKELLLERCFAFPKNNKARANKLNHHTHEQRRRVRCHGQNVKAVNEQKEGREVRARCCDTNAGATHEAQQRLFERLNPSRHAPCHCKAKAAMKLLMIPLQIAGPV